MGNTSAAMLSEKRGQRTVRSKILTIYTSIYMYNFKTFRIICIWIYSIV